MKLKLLVLLGAVCGSFCSVHAADVTFLPGKDKALEGEKAVIAAGTPIALESDADEIFYTADGTDPAVSGTRYLEPFTVDRTAVVKAVGKTDNSFGALAALEYKIYKSPYDISALVSAPDLNAGFAAREAAVQSKPARRDWYRRDKYRFGASWGPNPLQMSAPELPANADASWKRRRVLAAAYRYINLQYQHHRVPTWNPAQDWPYSKTRLGHQSAGIDCSNFTGWAYNLGLGINIERAVGKQAKIIAVTLPDGSAAPVTVAAERADGLAFAALAAKLKPGDLVFFSATKSNPDKVIHVALWVGQDSGTGEYLVIDSHDQVGNSVDSASQHIPTGVQLRAFRETSWYFGNFVRALRIIND